jgi:phage protein D
MPATDGGMGTIVAVVNVNGTPLADEAASCLIRAVVDTHLHVPGMFELTFFDQTGNVVQTSGLSIGTKVDVLGQTDAGDSVALIAGEVTSIEGTFERLTFYTVVRGYDLTHRLQRTRQTRTFMNMNDSDIATQVATDYGLEPGQIDPSSTLHEHLGQCDQTDWEFLNQRAREIGYETGVSDGTFYFRKASNVAEASGEPVALTFGQNLQAFRPRLTAGNLAPEVEVRIWDPIEAKVIAARAATTTGTASLDGENPASTAQTFASGGGDEAPPEPSPVTADLGPAPGANAFVVFDRPVANGSAITSAATAVASSVAEHVGSTFAEAEGEALGDPAIKPGSAVQVADIPAPFAGTWMVTNARHVFDLAEGGYQTRFVVSGRQDRSLLGLASAATSLPAPPRMPGLAFGIVTNNNDPNHQGRVKVALPWLSPDYETDWAFVLQFGAGKRTGAMFLPEVGDEVLVGFEFGDPRRPCVLGGIVNSASSYSLGGQPVKPTGMAAQVVLRGFVSAAGNVLAFHDEVPPGEPGPPPTASDITLGTGDGNLSLKIDQVAGTVTLTCKPAPPASQSPAGQLTIECGDAGTINIKAGEGGNVNIDGGTSLSLKAQGSIQIQSQGEVAIKGATIMLN